MGSTSSQPAPSPQGSRRYLHAQAARSIIAEEDDATDAAERLAREAIDYFGESEWYTARSEVDLSLQHLRDTPGTYDNPYDINGHVHAALRGYAKQAVPVRNTIDFLTRDAVLGLSSHLRYHGHGGTQF
ncbi:unnamed protein product [Zymoseptoria tritici ST99CH_1A5]|uniref:Uncharacterized protein n=2 Tax=Zymoseptoria tritici TaxID=1047171 RepID=A0A2H1GPZ4_ZYMTR|nr:unnamed protein product [Zymoseptoria tritici ST99CH_1E4]SMR58030.1 unnamed protein product [Zymoseptoria tritici ST99CH_3D1]SMY26467.1 unnamed protein product [Zymoseptoria tritici ST99CH_1A5]